MHELVDLIRLAALQAVENTQPVDVVCGRVEEAAPLNITIEGAPVRLLLRANQPELAKDDTVLLLRLQGGQAFLILDKAVEV
ncbi:MAG: DUF2577 family protein [Oscillospiraceae bacterium]|nr:DUF2577 family protein [Oscillospiraceae bacterium]